MNETALKTTNELWKHRREGRSAIEEMAIDCALAATREYENRKQQLTVAIEYCQRELDRCLRSLQQDGRTGNSLGVLQSNGVEVDRLCGETELARRFAEDAQERLASVLAANGQ